MLFIFVTPGDPDSKHLLSYHDLVVILDEGLADEVL
jgi:hypothetical protein